MSVKGVLEVVLALAIVLVLTAALRPRLYIPPVVELLRAETYAMYTCIVRMYMFCTLNVYITCIAY